MLDQRITETLVELADTLVLGFDGFFAATEHDLGCIFLYGSNSGAHGFDVAGEAWRFAIHLRGEQVFGVRSQTG